MSQHFSPEVEHALLGVQFIAQHIRDNDKDNEVLQSNLCVGNTDIFIISGDRGLEVHGHGAGQALPVALHPDLLDGHSLHHPQSSQSV